MPTHCCVPVCTKKGYRDENGKKISYFIFPKDAKLKKQWIHAIRREEGEDFQIIPTTKVCSRHFKDKDFKKTIAGKICLQPGAVPSVFSWRTSPRKRKAPAQRLFVVPSSHADDKSSEEIEATCSTELLSDDSVLDNEIENEEPIKHVETQTDFCEVREVDTQTDDLTTLLNNYESKIQYLEQQILKLERNIENVNSKLFSVDKFKESDSQVAFYTGFPSKDVFMEIYTYLDPGENGENIKYYTNSTPDVSSDLYNQEEDISEIKKGRPRTLRPLDEYFLVMCRLRQGFAEEHLSHLFHISTSTVSRTVITWINFMYLRLIQINIWPSRETIDITMPDDFKAKYKSTRVIIDCTEIRCQMPSSLQLNGELFSSYKNHTTLKGLIGISPSGAVTFVSSLYTGSISDREIVQRSGFLDLPFDDNDSVMADKGFTVEDLLPLGVKLNLPPVPW